MIGLEYFTTQLNGQQVMVATGFDGEIAFIWHGGEYIDVCTKSSMGSVILNNVCYNYGQECINVWDYPAGKPEIEWLDKEQFLSVIEEWVA